MNIDELASNYKPDQHTIDTVRATDIVLLVGISGAGKDTIQSRLLETGNYHKVVTHTTRQPRVNNGKVEIDGEDYHFVSHDQMKAMLERHQLIEVNKYGSNFYGTGTGEFAEASGHDKIAICNIDVNGVNSFREIATETVRAIFVLPPDYNTWRRRLSTRYHTADALGEVFDERRATAISELEHALEVSYYHFIINDDLDRTVRVIDEIAHKKDAFNRHDDEARLSARDLLASIQASS